MTARAGPSRCDRSSNTARDYASSSTSRSCPSASSLCAARSSGDGSRSAPTARKAPGSRPCTRWPHAGVNGIDVRHWLKEWLTACAENGGEPPDDLSPWLPWSMSEERRRELRRRDDRRGRVPLLRPRLHRRGNGAAARAHRVSHIALSPGPVDRVLPAHRMAQARRRPQGHDGPRHHARHAPRWPHRAAAAQVATGPAEAHRLRTRHRTAAVLPADDPRRGPLEMRAVVHSTREGRLWNEFVARYHYLGYKTLVGAQMRAAHDRNGWPVAMLGFSTAAWKLAPRDNFSDAARQASRTSRSWYMRFLILPWIEIPNLGSHILAIVRRRLPLDWTERYGTTPVLIETFVETPRYTGAVYRASGDPRRDHPGPGPLRQAHETSPAQKGHLAPPPPKRLATHPQSVESLQGGIGSGEQANKRITISSSPGTRTVTIHSSTTSFPGAPAPASRRRCSSSLDSTNISRTARRCTSSASPSAISARWTTKRDSSMLLAADVRAFRSHSASAITARWRRPSPLMALIDAKPPQSAIHDTSINPLTLRQGALPRTPFIAVMPFINHALEQGL